MTPKRRRKAMEELDFSEERSLKFEELVKRFRAKVNMIPEDTRRAIIYWHMAKRIQKSRMAMMNRVGQLYKIGKKVFWTDNVPEEFQVMMREDPKQIKTVANIEDTYARRCAKEFESSRWYNEVALPAAENVGLGPMMAGGLLWTIGDAKRFPTFGRIVRYAGLDVTPQGKAPKRAKGQKVTWNPELRTTLYNLTEVWNRMPECIWRARWDAYKAVYMETRPEILEEKSKKGTPCGQGHIHNMARRKVQREFLRNLYTLWCEKI
jgi:hypothetical protein